MREMNNNTVKTVTVNVGKPVYGYIEYKNVVVTMNTLALRHTKESRFSHYAGSVEEVLELVKEAWEKVTRLLEEIPWKNDEFYNWLKHNPNWEENRTVKEGFRDGVILITVPSKKFYSGIVKLNEGDELTGEFKARREGEIPRKQIGAKGASKLPAAQTDIVLFRSDVLAEDGDNTLESSEDNWEIISINASPVDGEVPINPETLCANFYGDDGGTDTKMTDADFVEALRESREFWRDKAMCN
jgi:hypothetical protein